MSDNLEKSDLQQKGSHTWEQKPKNPSSGKKQLQENAQEEDHFRKMKLEGKIALAMEKEDFSSAHEHLETVCHLEDDPWRKIYTLLQMIVCQTKREIHFEAVETLKELGKLMVEANPSPKFVLEEAETCVQEKSFSKGFALLFCACKLYKQSPDVETAIGGIKLCFEKMTQHLAPLVTADEFMKKGVIGHVIPTMKDLAKDMRKIDSASTTQARANAWCSVRISRFFKQCGEDGKVIRELERAVKALKKNGDRCAILGICLHNTGMAYYRLGKHEDAKKHFKEAVSVYHNADDMSDDRRNEELDKTHEALNMVR